MPLDHYVTHGRSGLRVSPLFLGTQLEDNVQGKPATEFGVEKGDTLY